MADKFQSIAAGLGQLKIYYQGPIKTQFNDDLPIMRGAEKKKKGWSGLQVQRPLKVRRNQGIGAVADGGTLPNVGRQTTVQAVIPAKFNYLRFGVTGPMIKASQSDIGSFVRAAAYELEEGYKDLKSDVNRQLSWDGTNTLAQVNTASVASTSLVIKGREAADAALRFIDVDSVVDIYDSTGVTLKASNVTVSAISGAPSAATATLTLSQAVTTVAGDILVRAGSMGNEIQGLLYALDGGTSTIYGVNRSLYQSYQGNVLDLGATALTLDNLQYAQDEAIRRGNGSIDAIYSDFASLRMYQKLLTANKRFANTQQGDGGFASDKKKYLTFNEIPWVADKDAPNRIMFLGSEAIEMWVLAELEFADETGTMYIAQTSQDAFEVRIRYFANMFNAHPASCAVLKNYIAP